MLYLFLSKKVKFQMHRMFTVQPLFAKRTIQVMGIFSISSNSLSFEFNGPLVSLKDREFL